MEVRCISSPPPPRPPSSPPSLVASFLFQIFLFHLTIHQGNLLTILSEGKTFSVSPGESLSLTCRFEADRYNLFDCPVLWRKTQRDEETQINIMGNINEPFMSSNRFEVSFTSEKTTPTKFLLELTILDISQEDSANYTCEVRGPHSVVLGQVTYIVSVRAPVDSVYLTDTSYSEQPQTTSSLTDLYLVENRPSALRCTALGGYPPPTLDIYVGRRDVTSDFFFANSASVSGRRGLRVMTYRTERFTYNLAPLAMDDRQKIKCIATVPGHKSIFAFLQLHVDYSPKIECFSAEAYVGQRDVFLRCHVRCKPDYSALFWVIDSNGTTLSEGDVINGHWMTVKQDQNGMFVVQLFLREVRLDSWRKYTMVAENSVSIASKDVELFQRYRTTEIFPPDGATPGQLKTRDSSRDTSKRVSYIRNNQPLVNRAHALWDRKRKIWELVTTCLVVILTYRLWGRD